MITGISGFAGSHLADYLLELGNFEVSGTIKWRSRLDNIKHILKKIKLYECDIRDAQAVRYVINEVKPDYIFHLAAQSYVPFSWRAPSETLITNIIGEVNIFEAVRELKPDTLIQIAGSSEEYGLVYPEEIPIKETNPLRPLSPYAVSKVAQDLLGFQYYKSYGLKIIRTRAFNHTGPRRGEVFVSSNFARQIVEVEKKKREPVIYVGNLEAVRDFLDVRDVVKGYYLALKKGIPGEVYNIASGRGVRIRELLEMLISFSKVDLEIKQDASRMRPSDVQLLVGDYEKFKSQTGWVPEISFEKTLKDLLDYWRERIE